MRRQINNVICVVFTLFRTAFFKIVNGEKFKANMLERISPNVVLEFNYGSKVSLGKAVRIHSGSIVKARKGAELFIGDNVKINYYCIIISHKKINIGQGTEFGPSVYLYDHDHDYLKGLDQDSNKEQFKMGTITIGENCWIGANTVILSGTTIGNNCVVGAGSVLKGRYEDNTLIVQKRMTSKKKYM